MIKLTGKTALVTGASHGIGRASALALAQAGAQVLVQYNKDVDAINGVLAELRERGARTEKVRADLATKDGALLLAKQARSIIGGRLDILVSAEILEVSASIEATTVRSFDELVSLNVRAPFFLVQQLLSIMCVQSSVVLVSSQVRRDTNLSAFGATQVAVEVLVKQFANVLGPRGIRVNGVSADDDQSAAFEPQSVQGLPFVRDVGQIIAFLSSDAARWMTGEIVVARASGIADAASS